MSMREGVFVEKGGEIAFGRQLSAISYQLSASAFSVVANLHFLLCRNVSYDNPRYRQLFGCMAINRIRIDYTVYPPGHKPDEPYYTFKTFRRAKRGARALGIGARVYREYNQTNKRGQILGDWWSGKFYWVWNGADFKRHNDSQRIAGTDDSR